MAIPGRRAALGCDGPQATGNSSTSRRAGRVRRHAAASVLVAVLAASYACVLVSLVVVPGGNRFHGWPVYIFCGAALSLAAAGAVVDNLRLARRSQALVGEAPIEAGSQALVGEALDETGSLRSSADI